MARKYALTRIEAGDYICPSNDGHTCYRFQRYEDGAFYGLNVDYEARPFWRVLSIPIDRAPDELDNIDAWHEHHSWMPTRAAAIDAVFRLADYSIDAQ